VPDLLLQKVPLLGGHFDAIDAWHGSPHRFPAAQRIRNINTGKRFVAELDSPVHQRILESGDYELIGEPSDLGFFDINRIGEGEGAQAYGHGLYLSEAKGVGEGYRKQLTSAGDAKVGDKPLLSLHEELSAKADRLPPERAAPEYEKMAFLEDLELTDSFEEALSRIDDTATEAWARSEIQPNFTPAGHLYNVDLNVTPDELLDWDAPLSGQSEKVKRAIADLVEERSRYGGNVVDADWVTRSFDPETSTGGGFMQMLNDKYRRDFPTDYQAKAAEEMASRGIPGIRYLDAGSRAAGEGTRNYVIFDDALIDIKQRMNRGGIIERKEDNRTYI
jgi:hypothetical protein